MENQKDSESPAGLLGQIRALAGAAGADFSLQWQGGALGVYHGQSLLRAFAPPVRAGAVVDFLRRQRARPVAETLPAALPIGPYLFHPRAARLARPDGEAIILTDKERDILAALWSAPGRALSREALLDAVWAYAQGVETHTLETHIYRLRRKIEDDPGAPRFLVNEEGLYRLNA